MVAKIHHYEAYCSQKLILFLARELRSRAQGTSASSAGSMKCATSVAARAETGKLYGAPGAHQDKDSAFKFLVESILECCVVEDPFLSWRPSAGLCVITSRMGPLGPSRKRSLGHLLDGCLLCSEFSGGG